MPLNIIEPSAFGPVLREIDIACLPGDCMVFVLGINAAYHESSACLIQDGRLVAAVEEERFSRIKHAKPARVDNPHELPRASIAWCLQKAGISLKEVDAIGFSFSPEIRKKQSTGVEPVAEGDWGSEAGERRFYLRLLEVPGLLSEMAGADMGARFRWIDHHMCHAASCFLVSPFREAAVLVVDGIGEVHSTSLYRGWDRRLSALKHISYPHSLGFLWEKLSKLLGFGEYDACKVMGLASYGDPNAFQPQMCELVRVTTDGFWVDPCIARFREQSFDGLEGLFGRRREPEEPIEQGHANIAAALQKVTEDALLALARSLHKRTESPNLCLAGGVALNCVANGVLHEKGPFERLYIQPAANDAGTAIGAALFIWNQVMGEARGAAMEHAFLGPDYSASGIRSALEPLRDRLEVERLPDIEERVADLLADGAVVGWFQGAVEMGPRALGNRSLLADPRNPNMRDVLNAKVKHREYFRPFAPSVLAEKADVWFRIPRPSPASNFMLIAYDVHEEKRSLIPAVVHVDGTSRIQTVHAEHNPRYHKLIDAFDRLTGVPMVLNTSLNDREPIVLRPEQALRTFLKTEIDYLALGDFLVRKKAVVM